MKASIARALLRLLGGLPFRAMQAVGAGIGLLHWYLPNRTRRHSAANIARCYPDQTPDWRARLVRDSLVATGRTLAESAWFWQRTPDQLLPLVREVHGREHLERARRAGRGIVCATPHLGAWELAAAYVARQVPLTVMFRPPRLAALSDLMYQGRTRLGSHPVPTDSSGVRALSRALRMGEAIGLLPDQLPRDGQRVYAPFMGQPALTMTLLSRMAARSGAEVLFTVMVRQPGGRGFSLHIWPAAPAITDPDPTVAATQVNREVEHAIALAPAQYMWHYQRFRRRAPSGDGGHDG
jgi:KDO2-lipid IV(A) lauroyltransferase